MGPPLKPQTSSHCITLKGDDGKSAKRTAALKSRSRWCEPVLPFGPTPGRLGGRMRARGAAPGAEPGGSTFPDEELKSLHR
jgi:hypothetical protein